MIDEDDFKVVQFNPEDKSLSIERCPGIWHCRDHEVSVKVIYSGICETDIHIIDGRFPCSKNPIILGHEVSGIVERIGMLVKTVSIGDKVVVNPQSDCYRCCACNRTEPHFCYTGSNKAWLGITTDGGWAEYCVIHEDQLFKLPKDVPLEYAVLCDPLSQVIHAWQKIAPLSRRQSVLLLGAGITGHLMASVLHMQGYRNVTILENNYCRRHLVKKYVPEFDTMEANVLEHKRTKDKSWTTDVIIDCDGDVDALKDAVKMLLPGGVLLLMKSIPETENISISPYDVYVKELRIIGSLMNPYNFLETINWMTTLGERYLDYGKLSIKTYPIKNYKDAIQEYQDGTVVKALFKMDSTEILSYSGRRKEGENTENEVDDRGDSGKRRCIDGQSIENGEDEVKNETTELEISNISSKSENLTEGNDKGTIEDNDKRTTEDNDKGTTEEECNEESN